MIRKVLSSSIVLGIAGISMSQFVPGRVVVMGPTNTDNATGTTISARQLLPTRVGQAPSLVTTLPDNITMSGAATTEGRISRSSLGRFLYFPAYSASNGSPLSAPSAIAAGGVQRIIGRLDFSGNLNPNNTSHYGTRISAFSTSSIRSATMSENGSTPSAWAIGANSGLIYSPFGSSYTPGTTTNSTVISSASTNNRQVVVFRDSIFVATASSPVGVYRVSSLATSAATMSRVVDTTSSLTVPQATPSSVCLRCDPDATANSGNVYMYVADESAGVGIVRYTSTSGWNGTFQTGASPAVTAPYRVSSTACRSICVDGNVLHAVAISGDILAIWDGGSLSNSITTILSTNPTPTARGIAYAPMPLVVDSNYSTGGTTAGNIVTLRNNIDSANRFRVGLVPDSNSRGWTEFTSAPGVEHNGTVIGSAVDSVGNTYVAIQTIVTNSTPLMVPAVTVRKIPYGGGTIITSNTVQIPTQCEAFGIFVDDTNRPVVGLRGDANFLQARVVRWAADLTGGTLHGSTFFSTGSKVPVDICAEPGGYALISFGESGSYGWNSLAADFSISANNTATISADGANALTPISAKFGASDGFLRVMSAGSGSNRALFRIDSLNAAKTTATASSRSYRRDGTAPGVSYTDNTASSPAYMLPWTMSMSNDGPKVLMLHTSEPNSGPAGPGVGTANRNDVYVGAGRIWSFNTNNVLAAPGSTYRFAPGIAPVN